jgi:farnesyl-diphosphate farnesyltransferase
MLASAPLLTTLLKEVSRSFYLTLRILPGAIRPQIGIAYLLARATDTIADTEVVPSQARIQALLHLRDRIDRAHNEPLNLGLLLHGQASNAEKVLLQRVEDILEHIDHFSSADQALIRRVLRTITSGQLMDLERFGGANQDSVRALATPEDLDDYTYRVAGCVGEFWTGISRTHLFPTAILDEAAFLADGIRFGKGLQLVNILRDVPRDLRQGRCYFPANELASVGLGPRDLLDPSNMGRFEPVYRTWRITAEAHLEAGWRYTNTIPRNHFRLRLACAWPVLIGIETLRALKVANVLDPGERVKVSRRDVRRIIVRSVVRYPCRSAWESLGG